MPDIPHFDMPFRYQGSNPAMVEQDSLEDVLNCVEAIVRTPIGDRVELPEFGVDDWTFYLQPLPIGRVRENISVQEPRAVVILEQEPDAVDHLIAKITLNVSQAEEG